MKIGYKKQTQLSFIEAVQKVRKNLQQEGFGVITEIDIKDIFKKKIDVNF